MSASDWIERPMSGCLDLAEILEQSPQPFAVGGPDGRLRHFNPAFVALTGYEPDELRRLHWSSDLSTPESQEQSRLARLRLEATGEPQRYEKVYVRKDGSRVPAEVLLSRKAGPSGETLCYHVFVRDITERVRATEAAQEAEALARALGAVNQVIHSTLDFDDVMRRAVCEGAKALGSETAVIALRQGEAWVVTHVWGFPENAVGLELDDDRERHAVLAIKTGKPVAVSDALTDSRVNREHLAQWGIRSVLAVPLIVRDEPVGMLYLNFHREPFEFRALHVDFAEKLGATLSLALENARLVGRLEKELAERARAEAALRRSEERLEAKLAGMRRLQAISTQLIQENDVPALYQQVVDAAIALMGADMGSLQVLHVETNELELLAHRGFDPRSATFWQRVRVDSASPCGTALRTGTRVLVEDGEDCPSMAGTGDLGAFRMSGIRAVQSTPLVSRSGAMVGMISTHWKEPRLPAERELRLLDVLARQAADLIERGRAQQRLEEAVRRAERQAAELDAVFDGMADPVALYDTEGRIRRVNPAGQSRWRYTAEEQNRTALERAQLLGTVQEDGTPWPEDRIPLIRALTGEVVRSEVLGYHRPHQGTRWVSVSAAPVRLADGTRLGAVATYPDITAQKEAQDQLRRANEELVAQRDQLAQLSHDLEAERARLHTIIERTPVGIVVADCRSHALMVNEAAKRMLGNARIPTDESCGCDELTLLRSDGTVVPPEEWPPARSAEAGAEVSGETFVLVTRDRARRDVLVNSAPLHDTGNQVYGAVVCFQDISPIKEAERERDRLEEMKTQFLSNVSHELRTPLSSVLGYVELVKDGAAGEVVPPQKELLEVAYDSGLALQGLIDELLDISRLESDRFRLDLDGVSLREVLEHSLARVTPEANVKGLDLVTEVAAGLPRLWGDARRLEQVLNNLLSNAIKFTPEGGQVRLRVFSNDGTVEIQVQDTGVGIDPEDLEGMFQRFFRGRHTDGVPGTGLGLYLAKNIVEAHGGTIDVESEVGRGSTFRVRLPVEPPR